MGNIKSNSNVYQNYKSSYPYTYTSHDGKSLCSLTESANSAYEDEFKNALEEMLKPNGQAEQAARDGKFSTSIWTKNMNISDKCKEKADVLLRQLHGKEIAKNVTVHARIREWCEHGPLAILDWENPKEQAK